MELIVKCKCGHEMAVSEFAMGMTSPCPQCGEPLTVSPDNVRRSDTRADNPRSSSSRIEPTESTLSAPKPSPTRPDQCARCGKTFRGAWDKHETTQGVLCNICRNLVQPVGDQGATGFVVPIESIKIESKEPAPPPHVHVESETKTTALYKYLPSDELMRKIALFSGVFVMLLAAYYFVTTGFESPEPSGTVAAPGADALPPKTISVAAYVATKIVMWGLDIAGALGGLYAFLAWINKLPNDRVWANLLVLTPVSLLLAVLYMVPLCPAMGYFLAAALIFWLYDCNPVEMFRLIPIWIVVWVLDYALRLLLLGLLAWVVV